MLLFIFIYYSTFDFIYLFEILYLKKNLTPKYKNNIELEKVIGVSDLE